VIVASNSGDAVFPGYGHINLFYPLHGVQELRELLELSSAAARFGGPVAAGIAHP
jgi:hypothetical protein